MEKTFFELVILILDRYGMWFLKGTGVTLLISFVSTFVGFFIGLILGAIKTLPVQKNKIKKFFMTIVNCLITCYVEIFRGTPMMVQSIVIYFGMQELMGVSFSPIMAGIIIVSVNTGAYMIEVVRGGIQSVDPGQAEAAKAIGMTQFQIMLYVVLPQAVRNILPAIGNEFIINIKDTSVLNVISVTELFFVTNSIKGAIYRTYETFIISAVIYFILTLIVTRILKIVEKRVEGNKYFTLNTSSTATINIFKNQKRCK